MHVYEFRCDASSTISEVQRTRQGQIKNSICYKATSNFVERTKDNYLNPRLYGRVTPDPHSLVLTGLPQFDIVYDVPIDTMHTLSVAANWILFKGLTTGRKTPGRLDSKYISITLYKHKLDINTFI